MTRDNNRLVTAPNAVAAALCLFACFLYMALPESLLNALGFHYTDGGGIFLQRIHPAAILVFVSFVILLIARRAPQPISHEWPAPTFLLAVTIAAFLYVVTRSGAGGAGFLIDTHMVAPMIALVLAYAPRSYNRAAALCFIGFAALDGIVGAGEFVTRHRIYSFDPDWSVLHETYFRASSLMGSPVASALFLPVALFAALSLALPRAVKIGLAILLPLTLVAFGGYFALIVTVLGLGLLGAAKVRHDVAARRLTAARACLAAALFLLAAGALAAQILASPAESMAAAEEFRSLLGCQIHAFAVFPFLSARELVFGVSTSRIVELAADVGVAIPKGDIDNPWVLMFLLMGGGFFALWLAATAWFLRALLRRQPLALTFAVIAYFIIASTSNSFGRKDVVYPAMIGLVACAAAGSGKFREIRQR